MSLSLYGDALTSGVPTWVRFADGSGIPLDVDRWLGRTDDADDSVLRLVVGPALDVGCGPGRFCVALSLGGTPTLGIDVSGTAVRQAVTAGAAAVRADVFGAAVPRPGEWASVLLVDGNIGIGGDPVKLLTRVHQLTAPGGQVLVETGPPGGDSGPIRARLERHGGRRGRWFWWARLAADDLSDVARAAGLRTVAQWEVDQRWFAKLVRSTSAPG